MKFFLLNTAITKLTIFKKYLTCWCINTRLNCFNKSMLYLNSWGLFGGASACKRCVIGIGHFWQLLASARFAEQTSFIDACTSPYPALAGLPWVYSLGHWWWSKASASWTWQYWWKKEILWSSPSGENGFRPWASSSALWCLVLEARLLISKRWSEVGR